MDAKIIPGPGAEAGRANGRANGDRHSIQSVDRALYLLETIAELGGEATLTELVHAHRAQHFHLPPSAGDADQARLRRQGAGPPALRARRPHLLSQPCLLAGRSAAARAALSRGDQPRHRRDRASRRPAGRLGGDARRARGAPRRARRNRQGRQGRGAARHLGRQGDPGLAAGRRDPPHHRRRHEALHRTHHHRVAGADRSRCASCAATATRSTARSICPA